ncbi:MAG: heavy-metal-associated domain-containing protein [Elusimicrobia bacterium]|nr:heavy-metal-associated domain-containing protein [Elusimicrobiota bacterium]MDE2313799.1 heavy-metal-associated domain-containing protein [Elusimicrobiota bacterium]
MAKKSKKSAVLAGLFLALAAWQAASARAEMSKVVMKIYGMDCAPCAYGMTKGLEKIKGVAKVVVSLNAGTATLDLAPGNEVTLKEIRRVVREHGFTPKEAKVTQAPKASAVGQGNAKGNDHGKG